MSPAETREKLRSLHAEAKAAGLTKVVDLVDIALATASALAIQRLETALADPGLQRQHETIVESLDAEPSPAKPPVAPPIKKPSPPISAPPASRMPPPKKPPPSAPRKITGPDRFDEEIPF